MAAAFDWIKVFHDLPDHPKLHALADALDVPATVALGHVVTLWLWCARYAPDGQIVARDPRRVVERAARWTGTPGAFMEACLEANILDATPDGLTAHGFDEHNAAHRDKAEKDRDRMRELRRATPPPPPPPVSRDRSATVARQSNDGRATVAGEREREKENTPIAPLPGGPGESDFASGGEEPTTSRPTMPPAGPETARQGDATPSPVSDSLPETKMRQRRRAGPSPLEVVEPTGDLATVWKLYTERIEPGAVLTPDRAKILAGYLEPSAFGVERLTRAIEGHAGSPFLKSRPFLRSFDRLLGDVASVEAGLRARDAPDWRPALKVVPPKRTVEAPPAGPPPEEAPVRDPAEVLRELREKGGMPSFAMSRRDA